MKAGSLSAYFSGVAAKRLSAGEIRPAISNQHEFNGVQRLKDLLGIRRQTFLARFIFLGESDDEYVTADGPLTWYDSREDHPTRSEHRLYYKDNPVIEQARKGDLLVIAKRPNDSLLVLIARAGSTTENQILWLFGLALDRAGNFIVVEVGNGRDRLVGFAVTQILEELGVEIEPEEQYLDPLLKAFGNQFPKTQVFSSFARDTVRDMSPTDDPDTALMAWMDREELLFRTLERHLVAKRIQEGFGSDVDAFISYSLSIQNRRKSRAGFALENHVQTILAANKLRFQRGALTEGNSRPDFLFPGRKEYLDLTFPAANLSMLGAKSTCKERWRQVLAEADRISPKHLLTLEPGISEAQTGEMQKNSLQLVLPTSLHETYTRAQRPSLLCLRDFVEFVKAHDKHASTS
jgi:hypothetical protein